MCHESSGAALTETIGVGKGSVTLDDIHARRPHRRRRPEPGHQPPAHADRAGAGQAQRRPHHRGQPAARGGPDALRATRRRPGACSARAPPLADLFLQVRVNGDLALFQALNRLLLERDATAPRRAIDHAFVEAHCDGFDALADAPARPSTGPSCSRRTGPGARRDRPAAADGPGGSQRTIVCWAMGLTQHRNAVATIREIVNLLLLRGNIGRPGAGRVPGARPQQRAGRPHDGHLGAAAAPRSSTRSRDEFGFDPPRAPRPRRGRRDPGHARRPGRACSSRWAATSLSATPDTDVTDGGAAPAASSPCTSRPSSTARTCIPGARR